MPVAFTGSLSERSRHDQERRGRGFANLSIDGPTRRDNSTLLNETQSSLEKGPSVVKSQVAWRLEAAALAANHRAARVHATAQHESQARRQGLPPSNAVRASRGGSVHTAFEAFGHYPSPRLVHGDAMRRAKDALRVKPQGYVEYKDHITREARDAIKAAAATRAKRAAEEAAAEEREAEQRRLARAEQYAQQKRATAERAQLEREIEELREQMRREPKAILL